MAVTVDIPGVGNVIAQNAAEDATLKEILRALKSGGGGTGSGGGAGGGGAGGPGGIISGLGSKLGDMGEEVSNSTTLLQDFGKGVKSVTGLLGSAITGLAGSAMDLGMELLSGGNRMSDFTQHIPLVGSTLSAVVGVFEGNVDTFRELSEVGASFGNDITQMNMAAAQAGLGLKEYAELIGNNAERMQLLGGSVTEGAMRFGKLQKDIRDSGRDFMGMGFTMEALGEHTAEYMEMQARQGRLQNMSDAQLRAGSEEYLMQIDRLAKVTGKSRKEAEALLKQQNAEANVLAMKLRLQGDELKNFENSIAFVDSELPGFGDAIKDMADGVAQTPLAQKLAATIPGFQDLQTQMGKGNISQEEYIKKMAAFGPQMDAMLKEMSPAQIQALMGKEGFDGLLGGISDYSKMTAKYAGYSEAQIAAEQKARDKGTTGLANFESSIANARGKLMEGFVESGIFKMATDAVGEFLKYFTTSAPGEMSMLEEFTTGLVEWVSGTVAYLKESWGAAEAGDGMVDKIMNFVGIVWSEKISPAIGSAFSSLMGTIGEGIWNAIVSNLDTILIGLGAGILTMIFAPIAAPFLAIGAALVAIFGWEYIKSFFGGVFDAFAAIGGFFSGLWDKLTGWLPSWLVGDEEPEELKDEGKRKKSWWQWGGDDEEESDPKADPAKAIKPTKQPKPVQSPAPDNNVAKVDPATMPTLPTTLPAANANPALNTSDSASNAQLIALLQEQNKLLKTQISATRALQGNLLRA